MRIRLFCEIFFISDSFLGRKKNRAAGNFRCDWNSTRNDWHFLPACTLSDSFCQCIVIGRQPPLRCFSCLLKKTASIQFQESNTKMLFWWNTHCVMFFLFFHGLQRLGCHVGRGWKLFFLGGGRSIHSALFLVPHCPIGWTQNSETFSWSHAKWKPLWTSPEDHWTRSVNWSLDPIYTVPLFTAEHHAALLSLCNHEAPDPNPPISVCTFWTLALKSAPTDKHCHPHMSTTFGFLLAPCRCILSRCDVHPSGCLSVAYIPPSPPKCDLTKKNSPQGISGCSHPAVGEARRDTMLPSILVFSPTDEKLFRTQRSAVVSCGQMKRGIQGACLAGSPNFLFPFKTKVSEKVLWDSCQTGPKGQQDD